MRPVPDKQRSESPGPCTFSDIALVLHWAGHCGPQRFPHTTVVMRDQRTLYMSFYYFVLADRHDGTWFQCETTISHEALRTRLLIP